MNEMLGEVYNIIKTQHEEPKTDWKLQLGNWLLKSNKNLPIVSNACVFQPHIGCEEKSAQTKTSFKQNVRIDDVSALSIKTSGSTPVDISAMFSTSSCLTCNKFESSEQSVDACKDLVGKKKAKSAEDEQRLLKEKLKLAEEEEVSEEQICEEVEYVIVQEDQKEHITEEHVVEEVEIKFGESSSTISAISAQVMKSIAAEEMDEEETIVAE